ncbi:MAG: glycosyltransferase family 2 protein [Planctomycetes bacterium]|nr:glycosyltransferase family 2 protein [Planctomycetota bacterium]
MKLSVVIPVFNERETIAEMVQRVMAVDMEKEVIVVDDGSTDGTREVLGGELSGLYPNLRVLLQERNQGKGAALRRGFHEVTGDVVITQDADLEYDPKDYPRVLEPILDGVADVVYGSRLSGGMPQRVHMFWHMLGNRFLSLVTNVLYNTTLTDMETGYKAFRADVLRRMVLRSDGFTIEPEITAKVFRLRCRVYEIPIRYYGRSYEEGKKIRWYHGLAALWALLRYRLAD